jgi:hypothetical protein
LVRARRRRWRAAADTPAGRPDAGPDAQARCDELGVFAAVNSLCHTLPLACLRFRLQARARECRKINSEFHIYVDLSSCRFIFQPETPPCCYADTHTVAPRKRIKHKHALNTEKQDNTIDITEKA